MGSEYCAKCRKYFKSLLQHQKKSACGQNYVPLCVGDVNSSFSEKQELKFHGSPQQDSDQDLFFLPTNDQNDNDVDFNNDSYIDDVTFPPGVYEIPVSAMEYGHTHTYQQLGYIKVLQFLEEHELPQYAFDDLMLLFNFLSQEKFDFGAVHPRRKSFMSNLKKKFPFTNYETIPVELEKDNDLKDDECLRSKSETVNVYRFDVEKQIRDLIASEIFHDDNNLVINRKSPFGKYVPEDGRYDEIHSGDWYNRTYDEYVRNEDDFLLAIKLYCNKTGCDPMLQRHALEPVMFTFTIFKRQVQQQCQLAWRHIGFLPDLDQRSKAKSQHNSNNDARRGRKTRNYHRCLEKILEPLIKIQREGINVSVRIGQYVKRVRALFPIAVIVGDAKSNDLWCCRVSHYVQRRMSRACYTPFEKCSDFRHVCKMVCTNKQRRLAVKCSTSSQGKDKPLTEELRKVSTVRCSPCVFQLDFGVSKYGQFLACTADPMHLFEGGWCAYVAKAFVKPLKTVVRFELDLWLQRLLQITRSSQRSRFPRITFSGGVTSMTNIASHEWVGVILAYLIAIRTEYGMGILLKRLDDDQNDEPVDLDATRDVKRQKTNGDYLEDDDEDDIDDDVDKVDDSQCKGHSKCTLENIVQLFEMMLCFHAFYKTSTYWKIGNQRQAKKFDKALRKMMEQLVTTLDRGHKSKGWNLQKIHELLHFTLQIKEFGNLLNSDAGVGERGLKCWAKKPGRLALKGNVDVFTESTTKRIIDSVVLANAAAQMEGPTLRNDTIKAPTPQSQSAPGFVGRPKYRIQRADGGTPNFDCFWLSDHNHKGIVELPDQVFELLVEEYFTKDVHVNYDDDSQIIINGYTELRLKSGDLVRAHPNFRSQGEFYDWVIMKDPNNGKDLTMQDQNEIPECELRAMETSRINRTFPGHVPGRIIALFKHPITMKETAMVHPCRPWTKGNAAKSSVIIECWSLQSAPRIFHTSKNSAKFSRQYFRGSHKVIRYVPMYHIVPIEDIAKTIFAIQEDSMFDDSWSINQGSVLVVADRETYWAKEFMEFD